MWIALAAAAVTAGALLVGGVLSGEESGGRFRVGAAKAAAPEQEPLARLLQGFSTGDTAGFVRKLEERVQRNPHDDDALALLGLGYQQLARETGDPTYYSLSGRALARARRDDPLVVTGRASLASSRHRFTDALALARRALELDPENAPAYGALGDSLLNLGRYKQAFAAYDRMAELSPSIASYTRIAHARRLLGRPGAAIEALELALETDTTVPEYTAWTLVQLGNVEFDRGRLDAAGKAYRTALALVPGYVHAKAWLARVDAARGDYGRAAELLNEVVEVLPLPEYAIARGDVLATAGRVAEAREAYTLVDVIERLFEANGVRTELQTALFDLDHDRNLRDALARAREAYGAAPGLDANDVLAWALYKNGRCRGAQRYSKLALRLGTKDALKIFHRGMIERCLGNENAGRSFLERALATNPYFSLLYAPVAKEIVR